MKLYKIYYDSTMISLIANSKKDILKILNEEDENIYEENGILKYKWDDDFSEELQIREEKIKEGIIQWETH